MTPTPFLKIDHQPREGRFVTVVRLDLVKSYEFTEGKNALGIMYRLTVVYLTEGGSQARHTFDGMEARDAYQLLERYRESAL